MHGLKALSQATALVAPHEAPRLERRRSDRASWARAIAAATRRVATTRPAPRVRSTPRQAS